MAKITVLGAGGWGMALAIHSKKIGHEVVIWSPFKSEVENLAKNRQNNKLLDGVILDERIVVTDDITLANGSDITIIATPSFAVRETAARLKSVDCGVVVNVAKGFEKGTMLRLSEVIEQELPDKKIVVLSGPSHAEEVAVDVPTSVVVASKQEKVSTFVQECLMGGALRIYTVSDLIGVEIGGALKNVIAVAAGIENGLKMGDNTRAALITRGLAEMARLGVALGGNADTFMGLSGLGDLVVTCMSNHSRNNRFGNLIGSGVSVKEALETVGTVEGYYAAENVYKLGKKHGVEMPITEQCYRILYENATPLEALKNLMNRPKKSEEIWN